jgi:hypothetical protein
MRALRSRLTYANVISTLCLFLLLGGGAYAASSLPTNSVGPKQLRRRAVTPAKLAPATVKKLSGHAGPIGPRGAKGDPGAPGPSDVYIAGAAIGSLTGSYTQVAATTVPPGDYLVQAKSTIFTHFEEESGEVVCYIAPSAASSAGEWDATTATLAPAKTHPASTVISLGGAGSFGSEQTVVLACKSSEGTLIADNARVWAVKVGSAHGLPVPTD